MLGDGAVMRSGLGRHDVNGQDHHVRRIQDDPLLCRAQESKWVKCLSSTNPADLLRKEIAKATGLG